MCLMEYIVNEMRLSRHHDGDQLFADDTITKIIKMAVDGWIWHVL